MTAARTNPGTGLGRSSKPSEGVRVFWIIALWVTIVAFVLYLVWMANFQMTGSVTPPWYLPMY